MKINERWEDLKEEAHANIQSEKGILNRQIRSIQTEGHFGDIIVLEHLSFHVVVLPDVFLIATGLPLLMVLELDIESTTT